MPHSFPKWFYQFTVPSAMHENSITLYYHFILLGLGLINQFFNWLHLILSIWAKMLFAYKPWYNLVYFDKLNWIFVWICKVLIYRFFFLEFNYYINVGKIVFDLILNSAKRYLFYQKNLIDGNITRVSWVYNKANALTSTCIRSCQIQNASMWKMTGEVTIDHVY